MIERFLLDGINLHRGWMSVPQAVELPALVHADETKPCLTRPDVAMPWAEVAMRFAICVSFPPARFVERFNLLQDFQVCHGAAPLDSLYA
jgi:hypothetical protein